MNIDPQTFISLSLSLSLDHARRRRYRIHLRTVSRWRHLAMYIAPVTVCSLFFNIPMFINLQVKQICRNNASLVQAHFLPSAKPLRSMCGSYGKGGRELMNLEIDPMLFAQPCMRVQSGFPSAHCTLFAKLCHLGWQGNVMDSRQSDRWHFFYLNIWLLAAKTQCLCHIREHTA